MVAMGGQKIQYQIENFTTVPQLSGAAGTCPSLISYQCLFYFGQFEFICNEVMMRSKQVKLPQLVHPPFVSFLQYSFLSAARICS